MGQANSMPSAQTPSGRPRRRKIFMWLTRIGIGSGILVILVIVTALAVQAYHTANAIRRYPPPGQLVDVGGYRLHMQDRGTGTPTVVLEAGMGAGVLSWALVEPEVAKFTRVISYDRSGIGWSDRGPAERTSKEIVDELNTLLKQGGIPGPYVLVGASSGGLNVRLFASEYADDVAGLVLVDPADELAEEKMPESVKQQIEGAMPIMKVMRVLAPLGIARVFISENERLPGELRQMDLALMLRTPHTKTMIDEMLSFETSKSQMSGCTLAPDLPLAVLSASEMTVLELPPKDAQEVLDILNKCQAEFASRSTNSFHLVVPNSGHEISEYQPAVVVDAIRRVVESVRNKTRLVAPEL